MDVYIVNCDHIVRISSVQFFQLKQEYLCCWRNEGCQFL